MTKRSTLVRWLAGLFALTLFLAACGDDDATTDDASGDDGGDDGDDGTIELVQDGSTLEAILDAGEIKCGTRDALIGFAVLTEDGDHIGFDADFCRVIAAAILGDATAVNFIDLETSARFTALQSGEIDVLVRNTTFTASRDGTEGVTFLQPTYYDGQQIMVDADSEFQSIDDMDNTSICAAKGTTTASNLPIEFTRRGLNLIEVVADDSTDVLLEAFSSGRCEGYSGDGSGLVAVSQDLADGPESVRILPETFSKEPLAPGVRDGDVQLAQAVNWAVFATIQAEEFGITSENVDDFLDSENSQIRKFLGQDEEGGTFDPGLGLPADFAYQVIKQVGNYAEIFDANLTPLGLQRGVNALWNEGGLMYAPPYK